MSTIPDPIAYLESKFGITLQHIHGDEYAGPCPFGCAGAGVDRLHVWADRGNAWCRQCGFKGFVDELIDHKLTDTEIRLQRIEREQRRQAQQLAKHEKQLSALEKMARSTAHIQYHQNLDTDAIRYWHSQGITDESIEKYLLGFCHSCPTARGHASYTIPYFASDGKTLRTIQHRLKGVTGGDRYRPEMAGLGKALYRAEIVGDSSELVLMEGSKKVIVASQETFPAIGVQGAHGFDLRWLSHFSNTRKLYIAFDPDAMGLAYKLGQDIAKASSIDVRIVSLCAKPDDFFVLFGGSANQFNEYLRYARRVKR